MVPTYCVFNLLNSLVNSEFYYYTYIILCLGDGDSSVCKRLHQTLPYGPKLLVDKIECRNHILRNLGQKISQLTKNTKYPVHLRNLLNQKQKCNKFRTAITMAIQYRKSLCDSEVNKIKGNQ